MNYKFTDAELKNILKELVILIDTREKSNNHITKWFDEKKIKYKVQKLDYGDYSAYIPRGGIKGIDRDLYFTGSICIERKANIDELAGNLKDQAIRLKNELMAFNKYNIKYFMFVEDNLFHKHLRNGSYRSLYDSKTLYARLKGIESEFNTIIVPVDKEFIASEIYNTLYYQVRHILKRELKINSWFILYNIV